MLLITFWSIQMVSNTCSFVLNLFISHIIMTYITTLWLVRQIYYWLQYIFNYIPNIQSLPHLECILSHLASVEELCVIFLQQNWKTLESCNPVHTDILCMCVYLYIYIYIERCTQYSFFPIFTGNVQNPNPKPSGVYPNTSYLYMPSAHTVPPKIKTGSQIKSWSQLLNRFLSISDTSKFA